MTWFLTDCKTLYKCLYSGPSAPVNIATKDWCILSYFFVLTWNIWHALHLLCGYLLMQMMHPEGEFKSWVWRNSKHYAWPINLSLTYACMNFAGYKCAVSKVTPVELRQTWLISHWTETEGRADVCLRGNSKVWTAESTQRIGSNNLTSLLHFTYVKMKRGH